MPCTVSKCLTLMLKKCQVLNHQVQGGLWCVEVDGVVISGMSLLLLSGKVLSSWQASKSKQQ